LKSSSKKKFVKRVKRRIPWISHLVNDVNNAGDLNIEDMNLGLAS
jgi:hypothetical protein